MGRKSSSGSGIRDEQPGSYFLEFKNHFFGLKYIKYLNSLMRIRDPGWRQFGSGIRDGKKSDPAGPGSATLNLTIPTDCCCLLGGWPAEVQAAQSPAAVGSLVTAGRAVAGRRRLFT